MIERASMRARVRTTAAALRADRYHYFPAWYRKARPTDLATRPLFLAGGWGEAMARAGRGELDVRGMTEPIPEYILNGVLWRAAPALRKVPGLGARRFSSLEKLLLGALRRGLGRLSGGPPPLLSIDQWVQEAKATPRSLSLLPEASDQARKLERVARTNGLDALYITEAMRTPEFRAMARGPSNDILGDIPEKIEELLALEELLVDEESVQVLHRTLLYRMTHDQSELEPIAQHWSRKYFPRELMPLTDHERLIDIGAFTGDTAQQFFIITDGKFRQVISLEPDEHNFFFLQKFHSSLPPEDAARVVCRKEGAWSERTRLTFHATSNVGSSIEPNASDANTVSIDVTTVDALTEEYGAPTFVKCEAEGADREVLVGGAKTLREHRPRIAVTAYHLPDDYLALVALLRDANPDYRLALRHYTIDHSGTTIYAY